jgi:hypothetical protein
MKNHTSEKLVAKIKCNAQATFVFDRYFPKIILEYDLQKNKLYTQKPPFS